MGFGFVKSTVVRYVNVSLSVSGGGGSVSGATRTTRGKSVTIRATPSGNYNFVGWYVGNSLLSSSATYIFTAVEDISIQARFTLRPGAPGSVVHFPMTWLPGSDLNRHIVRVKTSAYGATPVSVTFLQANNDIDYITEPVTIPTRTRTGSGNSGVKYKATNGTNYCYHSKSTNSEDFEYSYRCLAPITNYRYGKEYRINF